MGAAEAVGPTLTRTFVCVNVQVNLLVRGMGRAVPDRELKVVVFLNGAPVMVGIGGMPVPVLWARTVMGRRRRARTERMKCCIFGLMWIGKGSEICWKDGGKRLAGKGKEYICADGQSEWTWAFVDGQNVDRVERSLRSEVEKKKLEEVMGMGFI